MSTIKKTMEKALAFVTEHGNMSEENLKVFTEDYCTAKGRATTSGEPRELVRLYDAEGNTIGRRCSVLKVWLAPESFNGDVEKIGMSREANKIKTKHLRDAEAIVRDAEVIRVEANELEEPMEKLAKYEEYDAKLEEAKTIKATEVTVDDVPADAENFTPFETVEELAENLGVEVITTKAKVEVEAEETEA